MEVHFTQDMLFKLKRGDFLCNKTNKQNFIDMLSDQLQQNECKAVLARDDADVLIIQTAIASAENCEAVLVGDDTDLLILLCHHI